MTNPSDNGSRGSGRPPVTVKFTPPSYILKAKSPPTDTPLGDALEQADAVVARLAEDYPRLALRRIAEIEDAFAAFTADAGAPEARDALFAIAHDFRGQGGTFGFPLVTDIAASLCALLKDGQHAGAPLNDAIRVHIDSLKLVVSARITGDGGEEGADLRAGLGKVTAVKAPG